MKTRCAMLAIVALAVAMPHLLAAQEFEGMVKSRSVVVGQDALYQRLGDDLYGEESEAVAEKLFAVPVEQLLNGDDAEIEEQVVYFKSGKLRAETSSPDGPMYVIVDYSEGTTLLVFPATRSYMRMTRQDMEEAQERAQGMMAQLGIKPGEDGEDEDASKPQVRALGQTAVVNGVETRAYQVSGEYEVVRGWCAADRMGLLGTLRHLTAQLAMMAGEEPDAATSEIGELLFEYGIPIRTQTLSMDEFEYRVEDVLEIAQQRVPDSLFQVPPGYTEQRMPF